MFPEGQVPPVKGFWSLTVYNDLKFFHPNALNRFAGGVCRAGRQPRHDRYWSLLCRPCGGRRNDSVTDAERMAPTLCAGGIIAEFVAGFAGYYAVLAVWPNFYYGPVRQEYGPGSGCKPSASRSTSPASCAHYGGIKRALLLLTNSPVPLRPSR